VLAHMPNFTAGGVTAPFPLGVACANPNITACPPGGQSCPASSGPHCIEGDCPGMVECAAVGPLRNPPLPVIDGVLVRQIAFAYRALLLTGRQSYCRKRRLFTSSRVITRCNCTPRGRESR
jgi:hypothetical protein